MLNEKNIFTQIEHKWQSAWEKASIFEANPSLEKKFFMTIPYPYISGSLHIGHARVVTEADVFVRFQRMKGFNVLYPMAFHISGTPVLGISLAIKNGDKDKIELYKGYVGKYVSDKKCVDLIVKSFEDPQKIVDFFIPKMVDEFKTLGLSVDWRRSYSSGDIEHQALVEWQFKKYKEKNYLVQGKYPILFSLTLNNAVGEDDIKDGDVDPVEIQEFTAIKFGFEDGFLVAASLRPETMYGQTNMWVNPEITYVKADVDGEKWFISRECAEKLSKQDKKVKIIGEVNGKYFMGKKCLAPFINREIIILPSLHCDPKIGTGIVTSVPSDAPFDYIPLLELQNSSEFCKKYRVNFDEVKKIELIPIIESKGLGKFPAVEICKRMNITSLKDHAKLVEATQEVYKAGFHTGMMLSTCGPYSGMKVIDAKEKMRKSLLDSKKAVIFYETSRKALSRDGGEIVVAILDNQWFLDFNAKGWKELSSSALKEISIWPEKYRKQFEDVFAWLDKRPCARLRGLGTKMPFDKKWVIESLSDSTIYMALYPIVHLIRKNKMKKEQLTAEFFDFVMGGVGNSKILAKSIGVPDNELSAMKSEWAYWYPFDHRHTFTAHLSNHLSFMIFAHTAVFEKKYWPKRISFHGMIISEGDKMSKSKGNVVTLLDINEKFGADAFRAYMCNSTSVESSFNWETDKVKGMNKHLEGLFEVVKEIQLNKNKSDNYKSFKSFVSKTEGLVNKASIAFESMNLRDYSMIVLFDLPNLYKKVKSGIVNKVDLESINYFIGDKWVKMLSPLVPHLAEELWVIGGNKGFVSVAKWPIADESLIDKKSEMIEDIISNLRLDIFRVKELAKLDKVSKVRLFVAPEWKWKALEIVKKVCNERPDFGAAMKALMVDSEMKKHGADIAPFLKTAMNRMGEWMELAKFDEVSVLNEVKPALEKEFGVVEIIKAEDSKEVKAKNAFPGKPALLIE